MKQRRRVITGMMTVYVSTTYMKQKKVELHDNHAKQEESFIVT